MAQRSRRGCVLLALALLAAGVLSPLLSQGPASAQIDVLDLQQISTALLSGQMPNAKADFNHDGRVDILDFQCAVNLAAGQADSGDAPTPPTAPAQQAPTREISRICLAIQGISLLNIPVLSAGHTPQPVAVVQTATPSELLHQLGLSANAPPHA